jgi:hypothetical protein
MNNRIDEKRKKRFQFLHALYEHTGGNRLKNISFDELGKKIGLSFEESDEASDFLSDEDLIEFVAGSQISITHKGKIEIENALSKPENETEYFPPASLTIIGNISNSNIQQGDNNQIQIKNYSPENQEAIFELMQEIKQQLSKLDLPKEHQAEAEADIKTVETQLNSPNPKPVIIKESLMSLKTILENVAGNIVSDILLKKMIGLI